MVKFIWCECEVYDENYVQMNRHRDMCIQSGPEDKGPSSF